MCERRDLIQERRCSPGASEVREQTNGLVSKRPLGHRIECPEDPSESHQHLICKCLEEPVLVYVGRELDTELRQELGKTLLVQVVAGRDGLAQSCRVDPSGPVATNPFLLVLEH